MLKIYGASDDLIEFEGDIHEEAYAHEDGDYIALSNGAVFKIVYSDGGVWRITPVAKTGVYSYAIYQAPENDEGDYSDILTIHESIQWAVVGTEFRGA
jgi:hypothetical protein